MASYRKVPALNSTSVGTEEWVAKETTLARDLVVADVEDFAYTARRDIEWLNEYVSDILEGKNIDLPGLMQTPGRLKGALSPRKARIQAHSALRSSRSKPTHVRFGDETLNSPLAVSPFKVSKNSSALGRIDNTPLRLFRSAALPNSGPNIPDLKPTSQKALTPAASIQEKENENVQGEELNEVAANEESEGDGDSFIAISRSIKRADNTSDVTNVPILKDIDNTTILSGSETTNIGSSVETTKPELVEVETSSKPAETSSVPDKVRQDAKAQDAEPEPQTEKIEMESGNDNEDGVEENEDDVESPKVTRSTFGFASLPAKQPITKKSFAKTPSTVLMSEKRINASSMLSRLRKDPTPFEAKLADSKAPVSNGSSASTNTTAAGGGDSTVATSVDYSSKRTSQTDISEHDLPPPSPFRVENARVSVHYPRIEPKAKSTSPPRSKEVTQKPASTLKSPHTVEHEYAGPIKLSKSLSPEKSAATASKSSRPITAPSPIKYPAPAALPSRTASQSSQKSNSSQTSQRSLASKLQSTFSKRDSPLPPPSAVKKDPKSPSRSPIRHFSNSKHNPPDSPSLMTYTAGMFRRAKQLLFDHDQPGSPSKSQDLVGSPSKKLAHPAASVDKENLITSKSKPTEQHQAGSTLSPQKSAPRSPQKDTVSRLLAPTFASANRRAQSPTRVDRPGSPLAKKAPVPYPEVKRTKVVSLDSDEGANDVGTNKVGAEEPNRDPVKPVAKAPESKSQGLTSIELKAGSHPKTQVATVKMQGAATKAQAAIPASKKAQQLFSQGSDPQPSVKQPPKEDPSAKQPQQKPGNKPLTIKIPMAAQREMEQKKKERETAKPATSNRTSTAAASSIPQAVKTKPAVSSLKQKAKAQEQAQLKKTYASESENRQPVQQAKLQPRANGAAKQSAYKQPGAGAAQSANAGSAKRTSDQAHLETPSEKRPMRISKLGGPGYKKAGNQTPSLMKSTIVQQAKAVGNNSAVPQVEGVKFSNEKINFASVNGAAGKPNPFRQNPTVSAATVSTPKAGASLFGGSKSNSKPKSGDDIVLPEIMSESEDDDDGSVLQDWANSPQLRDVLLKQQKVDPDSVFGPIAPLQMEEVFKSSRLSRFRPRSSSANWTGQDKLSQQEIDQYASKMGYKNP